MGAGWTENIQEELAGSGVDHHSGGCQEGMKAGPRINRTQRSRWGDKGASGIVVAAGFWLLHAGIGVRLGNLMVFKRKNGSRTEGSAFRLWTCLARRTLSGIEVMKEM